MVLIWTIWGAWLFGWALRIPFALCNRMLAQVCSKCGHGMCGAEDCRYYDSKLGCFVKYQRIQRGAHRERNGEDVLVAMTASLFWPALLLGIVIAFLVERAGTGTKKLVFAVTPLTGPELERKIRFQEAEIERLTREVSGFDT